jgi:hypothetical protein
MVSIHPLQRTRTAASVLTPFHGLLGGLGR